MNKKMMIGMACGIALMGCDDKTTGIDNKNLDNSKEEIVSTVDNDTVQVELISGVKDIAGVFDVGILTSNKISTVTKNSYRKAYLYSDKNPYVKKDSCDLDDENKFKFENLEKGKYSVRVDWESELGGFVNAIEIDGKKENKVSIRKEEMVVKSRFNDFQKKDVKRLINAYESSYLDSLDGELCLKTLESLKDKEVVIITDNKTLTIEANESVISFDSVIVLNDENSKDAQISLKNWASQYNYAKLNLFSTSQYDASTILRAVMQIDIPAKYTANDIKKAILELTACDSKMKNGTQIPSILQTHKILKSWNEGEGTRETLNSELINGVTGEERFWGTKWNTLGIALDDDDASLDAYSSALVSYGAEKIVVELDLTEMVIEWINDPNSNNGFLIKTDYEKYLNSEIPDFVGWCSSEETSIENRPKLKIEVN